ncbi:TonB-dependent receptor domain-containing protein [Maribacter sp. CXY002]|uniref:TonB-dependent receptor n=1 Tax=Maribacter luteocoastalis TaxID=3407671 RepID=UPI003B67BDD4
MKNLVTILFLSCTVYLSAQETGSIVGKLTDKEYNDEPLAFANVLIKGTTKGATSDFDGLYEIGNLEPGTYVVVISYLGYETVEIPNVTIEAGKVTTINVPMSASEGVSLDEVVVTTVARKDSEVALLLDQKRAVEIKTTIGAEELTRKGVGDVATAVSKVTGVSKQEGSGDVYVRGLGDRYNVTTLNGLPLPSNDPSKKNIDLGIFGTSIVESIGIDKTFNVQNYGDFAGANIDILSRNYSGSGLLEVSLSSGVNTLVVGEQFYLNDGPTYSGFYDINAPAFPLNNYNFTTSWDRSEVNSPTNIGGSLKIGKTFNIGEKAKLNFFGVGSFSNGYEYREGINRGGVNIGTALANSEYDYIGFKYNTNTTAMANIGLISEKHSLKYNTLYLNTTTQRQDEFTGIIDREDDAADGGGFIQRATFERNILIVNQLLGNHKLGDQVEADWGVSYNMLINKVPNRRQNTLVPSINGVPESAKSFEFVSAASDNHRYFQDLDENELAANASLSYNFKVNEDDGFDGKLTLGYSGRFKDVEFYATQYNFRIRRGSGINQPLINDIRNIDGYFNQENLNAGLYSIETFRGNAGFGGALIPQYYTGNQEVNAGYVSLSYKLNPKFTMLAGVRGENITQSINWSTVIQGEGDNSLSTFEVLPSLSLKYEVTEKANLRFAGSKTYTLPQFKERAPFLFQEEVNQDTFGNPNLQNSVNYNADVRWEFFPTASEVVSLTAFGRYILDPINKITVASAANDVSWANTGDNAIALGAELEIRKQLFETEKEMPNTILKKGMSFGANFSYLNTNQKLDPTKIAEETTFTVRPTFTETGLSGASDFIANGDITYNFDIKENSNIQTTLAYNYFSDRIFALGSEGRGNLVDKGVSTLDFISSFQVNDHISIGLNAKNLLNPTVTRYQDNAIGNIDPIFIERGVLEQEVDILTYKKGLDLKLSFAYKF